jgi:hypothetical protein
MEDEPMAGTDPQVNGDDAAHRLAAALAAFGAWVGESRREAIATGELVVLSARLEIDLLVDAPEARGSEARRFARLWRSAWRGLAPAARRRILARWRAAGDRDGFAPEIRLKADVGAPACVRRGGAALDFDPEALVGATDAAIQDLIGRPLASVADGRG